jgi:flagellar basal-body rod modification protein FlgD
MSTNPVTNNPPNTTTSNQRTTAEAQKGLNASYQDFLKLLTVQLTNQDPTAPMDPTAMVSQLAQLSQPFA